MSTPHITLPLLRACHAPAATAASAWQASTHAMWSDWPRPCTRLSRSTASEGAKHANHKSAKGRSLEEASGGICHTGVCRPGQARHGSCEAGYDDMLIAAGGSPVIFKKARFGLVESCHTTVGQGLGVGQYLRCVCVVVRSWVWSLEPSA